MSTSELVKELKAVIKVHPEAGEAEVWASSFTKQFHVLFIGFDKRHHPPRLKLEG